MRYQSQTSKSIKNIVVIGVFAALSYVALMLFRIPYPAPVGNPFIHLGNMFVILAALLFGGWQGGLSGSIGMGLYDINYGYGWASIKTIILKFGIGLFVGLIASFGRKNPNKSPRKGLMVSAIISFALGTLVLSGKLFYSDISVNFMKTDEIAKNLSVAGVASITYYFLFVLSAIMFLIYYFGKNITNDTLFSTLGAVTGIAFNLVGEWVGGVIQYMLVGNNFNISMAASFFSLPATAINGTFSIVGAMILYIPLKRALPKTGFMINN